MRVPGLCVSKKKKDNDFPVKWAYLVGQKYELSTDWIMTGKGTKKNNEPFTKAKIENDFLEIVDKWLNELIKKEPSRAEWFRYHFEDSFPGFKKWVQHRETKGQGEGNTNRNVA